MVCVTNIQERGSTLGTLPFLFGKISLCLNLGQLFSTGFHEPFDGLKRRFPDASTTIRDTEFLHHLTQLSMEGRALFDTAVALGRVARDTIELVVPANVCAGDQTLLQPLLAHIGMLKTAIRQYRFYDQAKSAVLEPKFNFFI